MTDIVITPQQGNIHFYNSTDTAVIGTIRTTTSNNIIIEATGGLVLGNTSADVYVGDGVNNVNIIYEQDGAIRANATKTLTVGSSNSFVTVASNTTFTATANFNRVNESVITANSGTAYTIDINAAGVYHIIVNNNVTFTMSNTFSNTRTGVTTLILRQDSVGSRSVTWPASSIIQWATGTAPSITTTANSITTINLLTISGGNTTIYPFYGYVVG